MALNKTSLSSAPTPDEGATKERRRYTPAALIAAIISLLLLTIYLATGGSNTAKSVTIPSGSSSPAITITETARAGGIGIFGGAQNLGHGMNSPNAWENSFSNIPLQDKTGRIFTLKEAVGGNIKFTNYEGEGEGEDGVVAADPNRMEGAPKTINKDSEKLTKLRSVGTILVGGALNGIADTLNGVTGLAYDLTQNFVTAAFNPHTVCSDPKDKDCVFNVTKLVSGDGKNDKGIIGAVTNSAYYPFVGPIALIIILVGIYFYGFKNKSLMRGAINALYVVGAGLAGFAILMNAGMFTSLPIKVMQEMGGAAMSISTSAGDEETGASKDGNTSSASAICKSTADNLSNSEKTVLSINSMTCTIWRVVRLDPYSRAQFGRPFAQLDVKDPAMAEIIKKAEVDPNTFCVPLKVVGTPAEHRNKTLKLEESNHKVCNLAAYQMYLQTDAQLGDKANERKHGVDPRWYNVVAVAHADDRLWDNWSYSWTSASNRFMVTTVAMLSFVPIAIVMLLFSIASIIQLFTVVLMMILLPFIMLCLLDKQRGLSIAKRYGGFMLGAILSFILYSTLLAVGVIILSAIIDTVADLALVMVFNIIVAAALWKQRRQILTLAERSNPFSNNYVGNAIGNVLDRSNSANTLRNSVVGAVSGANFRSAWRNRNHVNEAGERSGFLRAVRENMQDAGNLAAEQSILSKKPNSMAAVALSTRRKLEAEKKEELQRYETAKKSEMENVRSDRELASNTVQYGQNATTAQANLEQVVASNANNAANTMRRTTENVQRLVLEFANSGDGTDRFYRETFADIFRAEQAMQTASHKRKLAEVVGDEYAATQARAEYNQARALKGMYEESLTMEQRNAYGEELNRLFQADPLLAKNKSAIEDEFAQARALDLQATQAGMETYRASTNANKSLDGLLEKEHQEQAQLAGQRARALAQNNPEVKKMGKAEALAFLDKAENAAIKKYLAENEIEEREGLALTMPQLNRLETPLQTLSTPEEHKQRLLDEQERLKEEERRKKEEEERRKKEEEERRKREEEERRRQQENDEWENAFNSLPKNPQTHQSNGGNPLNGQGTQSGNTEPPTNSSESTNKTEEPVRTFTPPIQPKFEQKLGNSTTPNSGNSEPKTEQPQPQATQPKPATPPLNKQEGNTLPKPQPPVKKEVPPTSSNNQQAPAATPKPVAAPKPAGTPSAKTEATPTPTAKTEPKQAPPQPEKPKVEAPKPVPAEAKTAPTPTVKQSSKKAQEAHPRRNPINNQAEPATGGKKFFKKAPQPIRQPQGTPNNTPPKNETPTRRVDDSQ